MTLIFLLLIRVFRVNPRPIFNLSWDFTYENDTNIIPI